MVRQTGPESDIVLSTRVRLARNLAEFPFPAKLTVEGRRAVLEQVRRAAKQKFLAELRWLDIESLPRMQVASMAERWLISAEFARQESGCALLLRDDERVSVMLCEEDHIRIQALASGLALEEAFALADELDSALGKHLNYAFDEHLGYLTQCPTNLGTAMRASVLLHLPALAALNRLSRLGESINKLGLTIRGTFGEGSEAEGALFQLSNQVTLGIAETQAIENLKAVTLQIAEQERRAQAELLSRPEWENKVWRAYGILRYARMLDSTDSVKLLSYVRMGAARGVLPASVEAVNALLTDIQPATLGLAQNAEDAEQRDKARATVIREALESN
jgi:protein arginine kinase